MLEITLESNDHRPLMAVNAREGLSLAASQQPDLVLLDLGLPDMDGHQLEQLVMKSYFILKGISLSEEKGFGLDTSNVVVEKFPLLVSPATNLHLKRAEK